VHNPENFFRRLLRVRHLQGQRPGMGDGFQKEPRRHPCRQPHLTSFQHNILLPAPPFEGLLCWIGSQWRCLSLARPHLQQLLDQRHPHRPSA
jgi:hypothetical protein